MSNRSNPAPYFYPEIAAGGMSRFNSTIQFYQRINALAQPSHTIVDFGAGRGAAYDNKIDRFREKLLSFKGKVREVIGADIDPIVAGNPSLDRAIVLEADGVIPLANASIDIIVSDFVFEHLKNPAKVAQELDRILVPGGWICARTPNRFGYIALANRLVPNVMHSRLLRFMQTARAENDIFPAYYLMNTKGALRKYFSEAQYDHCVYSWDSDPGYHGNLKLLFRVFMAIHAISPAPFKSLLLIFLKKRESSSLFR